MSDLTPVKNIVKASAILIIPRMLYRGVILYFCWWWFVVPYLGFPPINFWVAAALGGVISTLTFEHIGETKSFAVANKKMIEWLIGINIFFLAAFLIHLGLAHEYL